MSLLGPYLVACSLLVVAGLAKTIHPAGMARALGPVVPRVPPLPLQWAIRVLALAEVGLGVAAAVVPSRPLAAAVAASYGAFAGFVLFIRARRGALATCGCFSEPDTPATGLHVVANLALAATAIIVTVTDGSHSLLSLLSRQPLHGVPLLASTALGTWLCFLMFVGLARLTATRHLLEGVSVGSGATSR